MSKPYGSWSSPITSDVIVASAIGLGQVCLDGDDVYWVEQRPTEGGRNVVVQRAADGSTTDRTPAPFNARTRVHEYGGGAFTVSDGALYFSNFADQRLYRQHPGEAPEPLTPEGAWRYADAVIDTRRNRLICVREDHTASGHEALNTLAAINLDSGAPQVLAAGNDFYATPRLSPDGSQLAWITWSHPNMPWDGTALWVANIEADGALSEATQVAGSASESIFQPEWSPDGVLYFVSDRTGWWNLYRWQGGRIEALCPKDAEFGQPQWVFGMSTYAFVAPGRIICAYTEQGVWRLGSLDTQSQQLAVIDTPYTDISGLRAAAGRVAFTAGSPTQALAILAFDPEAQTLTTLRRALDLDLDPGYLSNPEPIAFPTSQGRTAHALFYAPANKDETAPAQERPPLIVKSHGGPTSAASTTLNLRTQYWTSRGFAVLDVNYGGSTGYGRDYRQRLNGAWGVVDVEDCVNGARYLVERGDVDGQRLAITGGSAGGYTTLCALTFHNTFSAGASHYGISDLEALAGETHKFESRYLDSLVGPYPERQDLYQARSPIHFTDRLACPLILFQGLEDEVVPPNQAEMMAQALRDRGVPVAYVPFAGEQHGFRRAENIMRALDGELYFYSRIFRFELAEAIEPVVIENL